MNKKSPLERAEIFCLLCFGFQLAHADGLGLAVFGKSIFALDGEQGVLAFSGKVMT